MASVPPHRSPLADQSAFEALQLHLHSLEGIKRRNQFSLDEKQVAFIVQRNLTVVWKIQCASVSSDIPPMSMFCMTTWGKNGFLHIARVKKNSDRSSSVIRSLCGFQGLSMTLFLQDVPSDMRESVRRCPEAGILRLAVSTPNSENDTLLLMSKASSLAPSRTGDWLRPKLLFVCISSIVLPLLFLSTCPWLCLCDNQCRNCCVRLFRRGPFDCWRFPLPLLLPFRREPTSSLSGRSASCLQHLENCVWSITNVATHFEARYCWRVCPDVSCIRDETGPCSSYLCTSPRLREWFHVQLPESQALFEASWVFAGFSSCQDLLHQGKLTVLSVTRTSAVYETPCLCSVGFFHRADKGFHAALRDQSQRVVNLSTAIRALVPESFHRLQRDRILFDLTTVQHLLRDWTEKAHVDPKTEEEVLLVSTNPFERWWLAQTSQVSEESYI